MECLQGIYVLAVDKDIGRLETISDLDEKVRSASEDRAFASGIGQTSAALFDGSNSLVLKVSKHDESSLKARFRGLKSKNRLTSPVVNHLT
jgi:hypothetical protein